MLARLIGAFRPASVATVPALAEFLAERAALATQKTIISYCHTKTQLPMNELMRDAKFADAFEIGRRAGFLAVLEDLVVIAEGRLRPAATPHAGRLVEPLVGMFAERVGAVISPPLSDDEMAANLAQLWVRLTQAQLAAPLAIAEIAAVSAARVYKAMPIHKRLRANDRDAIMASVRFMLVGMADQFNRRLDTERLVAALLNGPDGA